MYIIRDLRDNRLYFKGYTELDNHIYLSYTAIIENAFRTENKLEAEITAQNIRGEVVEMPKLKKGGNK